MENASKALLIAGAILIAIVLISLGMLILTQGQDIINQGGMSKAEKSAFNSNFTKYEGNIKGSLVRTMMQEVNVANADESNIDAGRKVTVYVGGSETTNTSTIQTNSTYTVACFYKNGVVYQIGVVKGANQTVTEKSGE